MNEPQAAPMFDAGLKIGFIGLGNMGAPMARCLIAAGIAITVQDVSTAAIAAMPVESAQIAATPAAVAAQADIVFMSLPTPDIVTAVCTGPNGVLEGGKVKIVVDLSTTGPRATKRLAEIFAAKGIALIDAPVSGGVGAAEQGSLAIMAAGDPDAYAIVAPFLSILGSKLFYVGERPGMGQSMKLVNNMLAATNAIAAFETLALGAKFGLDAQLMLDVLNVSSGQNFATSVKIPQCVMDRTFPTRFATNLMHKDVRLCVEEAEASGALLWVGQTVKQILAFAIAQGDGEKDYATIIQHFERWAGGVTVGTALVTGEERR